MIVDLANCCTLRGHFMDVPLDGTAIRQGSSCDRVIGSPV
jgi:hypothetical protein